MDHDATREQLELAAVEPGGLDRLMAGDTSTAQAVAAHLAGCPTCTDELARLERASRRIRAVVRESPPADLRERTLAAVRAAGVQRIAPVAASASPPPSTGGMSSGAAGRGRSTLEWVAAIAAAVVVSVVATSVIVGWRVDERLASQANTIEALAEVTSATLQVTAEPDARRVTLAGRAPGFAGNLIFSPSTSELVVVATGLTPPLAGQEYRCWVEEAGERQRVGKMFFSDGLAYWIGPAPAVEGLVDDATFGVSLVDSNGTAVDPEPALVGGL
ncbi:MAG: anti-sigma factor [Candidatus Limnocylindrales bacterium]|nr:anti-sigma factor [Candidatus Limnocylindrales bacterium]